MENESAIAQSDITAHPKILIDGKEYEVKFRISDAIRAKKQHGVDMGIGGLQGIDAIERLTVLLSIGISHTVEMKPEDLQEKFNMGDLPYLNEILDAAIKKVSTEAALPARLRANERMVAATNGTTA